jgi:hypothetical protein
MMDELLETRGKATRVLLVIREQRNLLQVQRQRLTTAQEQVHNTLIQIEGTEERLADALKYYGPVLEELVRWEVEAGVLKYPDLAEKKKELKENGYVLFTAPDWTTTNKETELASEAEAKLLWAGNLTEDSRPAVGWVREQDMPRATHAIALEQTLDGAWVEKLIRAEEADTPEVGLETTAEELVEHAHTNWEQLKWEWKEHMPPDVKKVREEAKAEIAAMKARADQDIIIPPYEGGDVDWEAVRREEKAKRETGA